MVLWTEWVNSDMQFKLYIRMLKYYLSDVKHGMVSGARQARQSISETDDGLGFSCTTISRV